MLDAILTDVIQIIVTHLFAILMNVILLNVFYLLNAILFNADVPVGILSTGIHVECHSPYP
jgi:hypothetical protein